MAQGLPGQLDELALESWVLQQGFEGGPFGLVFCPLSSLSICNRSMEFSTIIDLEQSLNCDVHSEFEVWVLS